MIIWLHSDYMGLVLHWYMCGIGYSSICKIDVGYLGLS